MQDIDHYLQTRQKIATESVRNIYVLRKFFSEKMGDCFVVFLNARFLKQFYSISRMERPLKFTFNIFTKWHAVS